MTPEFHEMAIDLETVRKRRLEDKRRATPGRANEETVMMTAGDALIEDLESAEGLVIAAVIENPAYWHRLRRLREEHFRDDSLSLIWGWLSHFIPMRVRQSGCDDLVKLLSGISEVFPGVEEAFKYLPKDASKVSAKTLDDSVEVILDHYLRRRLLALSEAIRTTAEEHWSVSHAIADFDDEMASIRSEMEEFQC